MSVIKTIRSKGKTMIRFGALLLALAVLLPVQVFAQTSQSGPAKQGRTHTAAPMSLDAFVEARSKEFLRLFDLNGDGVVDKAEATAKFTSDFERLDANGDGVFDPQNDRGGIQRRNPQPPKPTSSLQDDHRGAGSMNTSNERQIFPRERNEASASGCFQQRDRLTPADRRQRQQRIENNAFERLSV